MILKKQYMDRYKLYIAVMYTVNDSDLFKLKKFDNLTRKKMKWEAKGKTQATFHLTV